MADSFNVSEMLAKAFEQKPIFEGPEIKAIALATIAHNHAVNARKNRPIFASSIVKDIGQFQGMASGVDMNSLMMMAMMQGKEDPKPDQSVVLEEVLVKIVDRLDSIEASIGEQP